MLISLPLALILLAADPPVITIDRDNVEITQSCTIKIDEHAGPIIDADNKLVIDREDEILKATLISFGGELLRK